LICQCYRAGLYKQLATLKGLVEEYREKPEANQSLRAPIIQNLTQTGLDQDCPFRPASADSSSSDPELLAPDSAESVSEEEFSEYVGWIYQYLQVCHSQHLSHAADKHYDIICKHTLAHHSGVRKKSKIEQAVICQNMLAYDVIVFAAAVV